MNKVYLLIALLPVFVCLNAQEKIRISTPEVTFQNNILTVIYDITGCGTGDYINIKLVVMNAKGDTVKPVYITGDIGSKVTCGFGKKIEWNVAKDNVQVNEEFQIQVTGKPVVPAVQSYPQIHPSVSRGNILLSSALLPGLGQKKASGKGGYLAMSGLFYGTAGASLAFYLQHRKLYEDYKAATGSERDDLYNRQLDKFNLSQYLLYGSAGIWAVNMIWSAAIPIKDTSGRKLNVGLLSLPENGYMVSAKWIF